MAKNSTVKRPPVWMMVKQAVESMNGEASYKEIKEYIHQHYKDINERTVNCQIVICSVNQKSRVYYPANRKPRECQSKYDFLYTLGNGRVTLYDPEKHGRWGIVDDGSKVTVARLDEETQPVAPAPRVKIDQPADVSEPPQSERDFILGNFNLLGSDMQVYIDPSGRPGRDYLTELGTIDVLAVNKQRQMIVVNYVETVNMDEVARILSYMRWVRQNLTQAKTVKGILLAGQADKNMLMIISEMPNLEVYQVKVTVEFSKAMA